jgi:hypothetical protein
MRNVFALALLAGALSAQIPLPNYTSTYTYSGHNRGFYFQAPVNFVVVGLRVPDEMKHGLQNVEVFKMTAAPPAFPATVTGGQVFYRAGVPSDQIIPCALPFQAGEWFGVLGGCGDQSTMHSSYGTADPPSNVLGNPITLTRLLTQTNIVTTGGINTPYSGSPGGQISRVEVYVAGQSTAIGYGAGAAVGSVPAPTLATTALPILGKTATLSLTQGHATNQAGIVVLGRGRVSIPMLQGNLLVNPAFLLLFPMPPLSVGATPLNFTLPNNSALVGATVDFQGFVIVLPDVAMTNGMEWWLGL